MIKKLLLLIFFVFSSLSISPVYPSSQVESISAVYCCKELQEILDKLREMPEVNDLLSRIVENDPISIQINRHLPKQFDGYWSSDDRTVYITKNASQAALLTTLLFEMHNAANNDKLENFDSLAYHGQISPIMARSVALNTFAVSSIGNTKMPRRQWPS